MWSLFETLVIHKCKFLKTPEGTINPRILLYIYFIPETTYSRGLLKKKIFQYPTADVHKVDITLDGYWQSMDTKQGPTSYIRIVALMSQFIVVVI